MTDFYSDAASQRLAQIEAQRAQSLADLANAKANADYESAASSVQQIANLETEKANVVALHQQYIQSQQSPVQQELSAEEKAARPLSRMTWQDGLDLAKTSKYGKTLSWDDPHVRAGYAEAQARRRRGE
jgi:hypothetical protein